MDQKQNSEESALRAGEDFELEEIQESPWKARLYWAPGRKRTAYSVLLYFRGQVIQIDHSSREGGGRKSTGQTEPQLAIYFAEEALKARIKRALMESPDMDEIEDADGDLNLLQCKQLVLEHPEFSTHEANHNEQEIRGWDNLIALKGPGWSILDLDDEVVREYYKARTTTTIRYPEWLERSRPTLKPTGPGTAAKELALVSKGVGYIAALRRRSDNRYLLLRFNPFDDPRVKKAMISPSAVQAPPKRPLKTKHYNRLMAPESLADGGLLPAPVDEADPSGATRLAVSFHFNFGRRNTAIRKVHRGDVAETITAVRAILEEINGPVRPEWAHYFPRGIIRFRGDHDKNGYERIVIINDDANAELDVYDRRVGWRSWGPERPLFGSDDDPREPIAATTLYQTPEQRKARPGETYFDAAGEQRLGQGGEPCYRPDGEIMTNGHNGGRYQRARQIVRDRAIARGENPDEAMPIYAREVAHGWRVGWAQRVQRLGYGRIVEVEGVGNIDLDVNADYLGSWVMRKGAKAERYVQLDPDVLVGIAFFRDSEEILGRIRERTARETEEELESLAERRRMLLETL